MPIIDKSNILGRLKSTDQVLVELGYGNRKRDPRWIGMDTLL